MSEKFLGSKWLVCNPRKGTVGLHLPELMKSCVEWSLTATEAGVCGGTQSLVRLGTRVVWDTHLLSWSLDLLSSTLRAHSCCHSLYLNVIYLSYMIHIFLETDKSKIGILNTKHFKNLNSRFKEDPCSKICPLPHSSAFINSKDAHSWFSSFRPNP